MSDSRSILQTTNPHSNPRNTATMSIDTISASQSKYITIADINGRNYGKILQARILRMWTTINPKNNSTISKDMLLIDKEGNTIHARIMSYEFSKSLYMNMLKEGEIYNICKFTSSIPKPEYLITNHNYQVYMSGNTAVKHITTNITNFPQHSFNFIDYSNSHEFVFRSDNVFLTDVIGKVTTWKTMGKTVIKFKERNMREITIENENGNSLRVELLDDVAAQLDDKTMNDLANPPVVIITSAMVRENNGIYYLQSSSATKIYQNLDIPEAILIHNSTTTTELKMEESEKKTDDEIEAMIFKDRRNLMEINADRHNIERGDKIYICNAEIYEVHEDWEWKYEGCEKCKTRLFDVSGEYYCQKCNKRGKQYLCCRLNVELKDATDTARVMIFGDGIRELLQKPIETLVNKNRKEINYSAELKKLIGKKALFSIKIDQKSRDNKRSSLAVSSVNPINEEYERRYMAKRQRDEDIYQEDYLDDEDIQQQKRAK